MRRIVSSGSVKGFWLDKPELLKVLRECVSEALSVFPEVSDIRLIGSLARGDHTGLGENRGRTSYY